jgi:hypothetical protein
MTPVRPTGPIQADFAPLSVESSPSSSGTSTPDFQSARSGASTPSSGELSSLRPNARGFQQQPSALAAIAVPPPQRPNVPLNLVQEIEMRQIEIRNPNISEARTKTLQSEINILERQIRASGTEYTSLEERINLAMNTQLPKPALAALGAAPAPVPVPEIIPPVDQLKQIKSEITLIENQMATETNSSIRNAMRDQLKILKTQATALERGIGETVSVRETLVIPQRQPSTTIEDRIAQMKAQGKSQAEIDAAIDAIRANQALKAAGPANLQQELRIREIELQNVGNTAEKNTQLLKDIATLRNQIEIDKIEVLRVRQQRSSEAVRIAESDLAKVNVPKQVTYLRGRRTYNLNRLENAIADIELRLLNIQMPREQRQALVAEQQEYRKQIEEARKGEANKGNRINKTVTPEAATSAPVASPANDNLRATQPTRELESRLRPTAEMEMRPLGRNYFPESGEIVQAAMQQMGSRRPLERGVRIEPREPSTAGRAALERARSARALGPGAAPGAAALSERSALDELRILDDLRIIGPELPESAAAGVGFELGAPEGAANRERIRQFIEEPTEPVRRAAPGAAPVEEMGEEIGGLRAQNAVAEFNDITDLLLETAKREGFVIPEAPKTKGIPVFFATKDLLFTR